jgi:uncharacterized protein YdeI (YjbR/CyaY-like superfamily)
VNPKVDFFFEKATQWAKEFALLRQIILKSELDEELKWGKPCYSLAAQNVVLIHGFKNYCAVLFMQGALLKDEQKLLVQQTEHVQAGRQLRFTSLAEIKAQQNFIKTYVMEAKALQQAGAKVIMNKSIGEIPDALREEFDHNPDLRTYFEALTPGRQRGYILYLSSAKQETTRKARVAKVSPRILAGLGLDD